MLAGPLDERLAELISLLKPGVVITDHDLTDKYRRDPRGGNRALRRQFRGDRRHRAVNRAHARRHDRRADATKLFVGSEGILGVVTEATLRLLPRQSAAATVVASFATAESAVEAVMLTSRTLRPAMLEFMDRTTINAVEDWLKMGLDREAAAMLVAQTDAEGAASGRELNAIVSAFKAAGATEVYETDDPAEGDQFVVARRQAIPAVERKGRLLLEDVGVPLPRLTELVSGIERIADEHGLTIALIAHAGDGNTHPLIVFDPAVPELSRHAELAFGEIMDLAIALGGTITGEHGVGRLKQPWLASQLGPDALALTRRIKQAIDPASILNPGVIL